MHLAFDTRSEFDDILYCLHEVRLAPVPSCDAALRLAEFLARAREGIFETPLITDPDFTRRFQ